MGRVVTASSLGEVSIDVPSDRILHARLALLPLGYAKFVLSITTNTGGEILCTESSVPRVKELGLECSRVVKRAVVRSNETLIVFREDGKALRIDVW